MRLALLVLFLGPIVSAVLLSGCASYRSFTSVRSEVPQSQFVRVGGQLVHVEQAGQGEPVLLLHGFGASSYSWRKVIPALSESHRGLAIDLNGFGYTEGPTDLPSHPPHRPVALVLGVMDTLGIDRAHFIRHSYGGALSMFRAFV